ncbi:hypothetical protein LTR08_005498 [Meristemomyces frigidus]|nr:hypothetical protein LTR08_005498 [Meristemomyces frigidus]
MTMATGGVANVIHSVPYRFPGLYAIGCIFFLLNIVLFLINVVMISCRFRLYPSTFTASITHPTESLFVPASLISIGTILVTITEYGLADGKTGLWLLHTMRALFWTYCALAVFFSCGIYLVMWSTQTYTIAQMTPVWIFPAYPLLFVGPYAGVLSVRTDGIMALQIIIGGFVFQGIGFMVSLMIYAAFIYRLMTQKLPQESLRPGMFISVGPSGFTIAGVVSMGQQLPRVVPSDFMGKGMGELAGKVSMIAANWLGLWLWGLAFWFFFVSVGAHWSIIRNGRGKFSMTFYSYIFPNTGAYHFTQPLAAQAHTKRSPPALTTATFALGKALNNHPIQILGCVMTCLLIVAWFAIFIMMIRAIIAKDVLWPQKQEDRAEGGWETHPEESRACDPRWCSSDVPMHDEDHPAGIAANGGYLDAGAGATRREVSDSGFDGGSTLHLTAGGLGHDGVGHPGWISSNHGATTADRSVDLIVKGNDSGKLGTEDEMADVADMV